MIDIGVNLTNSRFEKDLPDVIEQAKHVGVSGLIITGTNLNESEQAHILTMQYPQMCYSTAGVHPHDASTMISERDWLQLKTLAQQPNVVAIGECGLDFNRDFSPRDVQEQVFERQLALAAELKLPVFLHCRDAHERFCAIYRQWQDKLVGGVLHCFTGSVAELHDCLALDLHIGVTGWVCDERRGQELQLAVPLIPDNRLMIETDAPYLLPRTLRPKPKSSRNLPMYLPHIAEKVAELRGCSFESIQQVTLENTKNFFGLLDR